MTECDSLGEFYPNKTTAVWLSVGFILGIILTVFISKCFKRKRKKHSRVREESYYQENAVYWEHGHGGLLELREQRRTEVEILSANSRDVGTQTEIDGAYIEQLERECPQIDLELDDMAIAPPPPLPLQEDCLSLPTVPKPPRRLSKDDCIPQIANYRKSHLPAPLQNTWFVTSQDELSSGNLFTDILNDAFKDQNSPLHREEEHYMSVPSVVLIPNCDDAPPNCHATCGHSYINMNTLTDENNESECSSLSKSQQIPAEYENTTVWIKSNESDLNDDDTRFDCHDKQFQDSIHATLRRKEMQSRMETDDQYSAFASLTVQEKPERPRTGYVVMELTDELMSFLKIREKREGKCTGSNTSQDIETEIYYDDRLKNGYISMHDQKQGHK